MRSFRPPRACELISRDLNDSAGFAPTLSLLRRSDDLRHASLGIQQFSGWGGCFWGGPPSLARSVPGCMHSETERNKQTEAVCESFHMFHLVLYNAPRPSVLSVRLGLDAMLNSTISRCRHGLRLLLDRDGRGGLNPRDARRPPAARPAAARHPRPPSPPPTRQQCSPLASRTNSQSGSRLSLTDDERLTIGGAPTDVQRPRRSQTVLARSVGRGTPPSASFHAHSRNRRTSGERHPRLDPRARRRRPCLAACRLANSLVSKH